MKKKFAELKEATCSALVKQGILIDELVTKITDLPIDFEEYDKDFLEEHSNNLYSCQSIPALFVCLRFHWDYLHPDIYGHLIEEFNLLDLNPNVRAYQKDLDCFLDRTLLEDFCVVERPRKRYFNCHNAPEGFAQCVTGHCWDPPVYLRHVEYFRQEFADYLSLKQCAAVVVGIIKGSVILAMWVPKSIKSKIESVDPNFLSKHTIVFMEFQCNIVYIKVSVTISQILHDTVLYKNQGECECQFCSRTFQKKNKKMNKSAVCHYNGVFEGLSRYTKHL